MAAHRIDKIQAERQRESERGRERVGTFIAADKMTQSIITSIHVFTEIALWIVIVAGYNLQLDY